MKCVYESHKVRDDLISVLLLRGIIFYTYIFEDYLHLHPMAGGSRIRNSLSQQPLN